LIHQAQLDGPHRWLETRRWNLRRPVAAAIPRSRGGLIIASGTDILTWDEEGAPVPFAQIDSGAQLLAINDAKCDCRGRLWAGTLTRDFRPGAAALFRIDPDGSVNKVLEGMTLANGLDWSPDGSTFFLIDSLIGCLDGFDFNEVRGTIDNRRRIVTFARG